MKDEIAIKKRRTYKGKEKEKAKRKGSEGRGKEIHTLQ